MKQLKYFMYCLLILPIINMGMKPREIEDTLREAFLNFNLTDLVPTTATPETSVALWNYSENKCDLHPEATTDKDLCTFAAHWLAASIKNGTIARVRNTFNAGTAGTFALLLPGLFLAQDSSLRAYAALSVLGLTAINAPAKIAQWMKRKCDQESFSLANAKLFEKEKYQALLSYFTHLQMQDHAPLSYDEKSLLIQKIAARNSAYFNYTICRKTSPKTISTSLQKSRKNLADNITKNLSEKEFNNYEAGYFPLSLNS